MARTEPRELVLGTCRQCGGQVRVYMQRGVPIGQYETEEFCSAECCRAHHGVQLMSVEKKPKSEEAAHS